MMLLAQSNLLIQWSNRLRAGGLPLGWQGVLVVAALATAIIVATWLLMRWLRRRERRAANSPARLLAELAAAHGLRYRQRHLLSRLAQFHALSQPAVLFVEPALWTSEKLGPSWDRYRHELDVLQRQLFA